jgi:basic amino acid/polyamine antiporter, APA family
MTQVPARRRDSVESVLSVLAATVGCGVFAVFGPAAGHAGSWLPVAVLLAGAAALLNAWSAAGAVARYPGPGGYPSCRMLLAPWAGRAAGALLLAGTVAATAAAARVFAAYVLPGDPRCIAVPVILIAGALTAAGLRPGQRGLWVVACGVAAVLLVVVLVGLLTRPGGSAMVPGMDGISAALPDPGAAGAAPPARVGVSGVLTAAALVFFAFVWHPVAGRESHPGAASGRWVPRRTLLLALLLTLAGYLAVVGALLHALGPTGLAGAGSALAAAVGAVPSLGVLVRIGAAAASATVMMEVLAAAVRTTTAMARRRDLPRVLAAGPRDRWAAGAVALCAVAVALLAGPGMAIALSAGCLLLYFVLVQAAVLRLTGRTGPSPAPGRARAADRAAAVLGLVLSATLVVALPRAELLVAVAVLVLGGLCGPRPGQQPARPVSRPPVPADPRDR